MKTYFSFSFSQQALRCRHTVVHRSRPPWRSWSHRPHGWLTTPLLRWWLRPKWRFPQWRVDVRERDHTSSNPETWTSWRPLASRRTHDTEAARHPDSKGPMKWKSLSRTVTQPVATFKMCQKSTLFIVKSKSFNIHLLSFLFFFYFSFISLLYWCRCGPWIMWKANS